MLARGSFQAALQCHAVLRQALRRFGRQKFGDAILRQPRLMKWVFGDNLRHLLAAVCLHHNHAARARFFAPRQQKRARAVMPFQIGDVFGQRGFNFGKRADVFQRNDKLGCSFVF